MADETILNGFKSIINIFPDVGWVTYFIDDCSFILPSNLIEANVAFLPGRGTPVKFSKVWLTGSKENSEIYIKVFKSDIKDFYWAIGGEEVNSTAINDEPVLFHKFNGSVYGVDLIIWGYYFERRETGFYLAGKTEIFNNIEPKFEIIINNIRFDFRGWLGIYMGPNETGIKGALVTDIVEYGPAAKAGIQKGDIIISVNGKSVSNSEELQNAIFSIQSHGIVQVKILRDKLSQIIDVKL